MFKVPEMSTLEAFGAGKACYARLYSCSRLRRREPLVFNFCTCSIPLWDFRDSSCCRPPDALIVTIDVLGLYTSKPHREVEASLMEISGQQHGQQAY